MFLRILAASAAILFAGPASAQTSPSVDAAVKPIMADGHFPGVAVAVMRDGKPVHVGTYGKASLELGVPVTEQSVFELASLTKHMTALAVMSLVEEGALSLDDHLVDYIDEAPEGWDTITVGQLVSHKAGLEHHFEQQVNGSHLLDYSTEDMLASARATPMLSEPGTDWAYSDQGYFLLGVIIEAVTGQRFADHMHDTFFAPLGMDQTHMLDQSAVIPHRVEGYAFKDGELQRNRRDWQFELTPHFGVMSSLTDMMKWEAELADPATISSKAFEATWDIQRPFDTGQSCDTWGHARGWWSSVVDGERILTHAGYAGTAYIRAVDRGISVIVLTNRQDGQDQISPMAIAWAAAHAVDPALPEGGLTCWQ